MTPSCGWAVCVIGLFACQMDTAAQDAPGEMIGIPAFTPSVNSQLAYSDAKWVVWTVADQFGDPRKRAISFRTRYFRQKLGEREGSLVFEMQGTYSRKVATVLDDGTLAFASLTYLEWVLPDGQLVARLTTVDGAESRILQVYRDGLLLQPIRRRRNEPIYFVPFVDHELDIDRKIAITDQEGLPADSTFRILRSGNQFAIGGCVFDIIKLKRVKLNVPDWSIATAFDGSDLVLFNSKGHMAISLSDEMENILDKPGSRTIGSRIFLIRNRVGYFLDYPNLKDSDHLVLKAISLLEPERGAIELARIPLDDGPHGMGRGGLFNVDFPHVKTKKGLIMWNATIWQIVPWHEASRETTPMPNLE